MIQVPDYLKGKPVKPFIDELNNNVDSKSIIDKMYKKTLLMDFYNQCNLNFAELPSLFDGFNTTMDNQGIYRNLNLKFGLYFTDQYIGCYYLDQYNNAGRGTSFSLAKGNDGADRKYNMATSIKLCTIIDFISMFNVNITWRK